MSSDLCNRKCPHGTGSAVRIDKRGEAKTGVGYRGSCGVRKRGAGEGADHGDGGSLYCGKGTKRGE